MTPDHSYVSHVRFLLRRDVVVRVSFNRRSLLSMRYVLSDVLNPAAFVRACKIRTSLSEQHRRLKVQKVQFYSIK